MSVIIPSYVCVSNLILKHQRSVILSTGWLCNFQKKVHTNEQEKLLFQLKSGNKFASFTSISTLLSDRQKVPVVFTINTERVIKTTKRPNNNTHIRIYIAQSDELNRPRSFCKAAEALP